MLEMTVMMNAIKLPIRAALASAGLSIQKIRHEPYEELWDVPRFTKTTIELLGRPFQIADARSFFFSYREIFVQEIYRFDTNSASPRIIDCGSNYGTSIAYFKNLYPKARITAVEADPNIFQLLSENCAGLDVELINKAVSNDNEPLEFFCEGSDAGRAGHGFSEAKGSVRVAALTLDDLIDGHVDFLKIDIEGSECDAIEACKKLSQVDQMFVEYHSFKESTQSLGTLLNKLRDEGFRYYIHHQFCSPTPLTREQLHLGMDLQLNIFAKRS